MKQEKLKSGIVAVILGTIIAIGSIGCLTTGFEMTFSATELVFWYICVLALGAVCCSRSWGIWLLGLGALAVGYLWHSSNLTEQFYALLHVLTTRYHNAYGIGVYGSPGETGELLALLGTLIGLWAVYVVCCRKGSTLAVFFALLPLGLCLVVTDTVPDERYLYCLLYGVIMLIMTGYVRRQDEAQGVRLSAMLALPLAAALGLMFWLAPQDGYDKHPKEAQQWLMEKVAEMPETFGDLSDRFAGQLEGAPQSERLDLREIGPLRQYKYPVMEVVSPRTGVLYLRERDYDQYTGTGWEATEDRVETLSPEEDWESIGEITITTQRARSLYVLPYYPGDTPELEGGAVENEDREKEYSFTLYEMPADWHYRTTAPRSANFSVVHADGTRFDGQELKYLGLPRTTREGLGEILPQLLTNERTATEIALTVADYVRASAEYDLNTSRMPREENDFALWFLNSSDSGYCVHFATATAVLLRATGVEARYVTGYMVKANAGETVTVTEEDAHAWVEYYEPRLGAWMVLESTPAAMYDPRPEPSQPRPSQSTRPTQGSVPTETTPKPQTPQQTPQQTPEEKSGNWIWAVVLGCVAVLCLPARRWAILSRREKAKNLPANQYALKLWGRCEDLANALDTQPPKELEDIAQKAKFSQHTLSEGELAALEGYVAEAVAACGKKPFYRRLMYRYRYVLY